MASNGPLEDIVTCPICQEVYRDPLALSCLHTLCSECIDSIKRKQAGHSRHGIECPICREVTKIKLIKKDFKVQSLVDIYKVESENKYAGVTYSIPCEICKGNEISWRCIDCDMYICHKCKTGHLEIPACRRHVIQGIEEIMKKKILCLGSLLESYDTTKETVHQYIAKVREDHDIILDKEEQLLSHVEDKKHELLSQIEDYCQGVKESITQVLDKDKNEVSTALQNAQKFLTALQDNMETLSIIKRRREPQTLLLDPNSIMANSGEELSTIKLQIPEYQERTSTEISLHGESANLIIHQLENWLNVHMETGLGSNADENRLKPHSLRKWSNPNNIVSQDITAPCKDCNSITQVNNHIWCMNDQRITVFSPTGQHIKSVTPVKSGRAAVSTRKGNVIVACAGTSDNEMGLMLLDPNATFIRRLVKGRFIDLSISSDTIATLDYEAGDIKIYSILEETKGSLQLELPGQTIRPDLKLSIFDTVKISGSYIFVASFCHNHIIRYTMQGEVDRCFTNESLVQNSSDLALKNPRICLSDDEGSVIFINFGSVLSIPVIINSDGIICAMNHPEGQQHHGHKYLDVTSDSQGHIWVLKQKTHASILGLGHYNICRYKIAKQQKAGVDKSSKRVMTYILVFTFALIFMALLVLFSNHMALMLLFVITATFILRRHFFPHLFNSSPGKNMHIL